MPILADLDVELASLNRSITSSLFCEELMTSSL